MIISARCLCGTGPPPAAARERCPPKIAELLDRPINDPIPTEVSVYMAPRWMLFLFLIFLSFLVSVCVCVFVNVCMFVRCLQHVRFVCERE